MTNLRERIILLTGFLQYLSQGVPMNNMRTEAGKHLVTLSDLSALFDNPSDKVKEALEIVDALYKYGEEIERISPEKIIDITLTNLETIRAALLSLQIQTNHVTGAYEHLIKQRDEAFEQVDELTAKIKQLESENARLRGENERLNKLADITIGCMESVSARLGEETPDEK